MNRIALALALLVCCAAPANAGYGFFRQRVVVRQQVVVQKVVAVPVVQTVIAQPVVTQAIVAPVYSQQFVAPVVQRVVVPGGCQAFFVH